jgi:2-keto-4-pentenoate hydratase/2-oxohepta-3-ene-1,7-dioic acid hydratase in catechol pathway
MRFASWSDPDAAGGGVTRLGVLGQGDLLHALPPGSDLVRLLGGGLEGLLEAGRAAVDRAETTPLAQVRLTAPLRPGVIRDFFTFEEHVVGTAMRRGRSVPSQWYEIPTFYFTNPYAVIGPDDDVPMPPGCVDLDFELEVGAVIGAGGANLDHDQARASIAGYLIFNDWSARDLQLHEMAINLGPAKGKDGAITLGPWLVTADELEPYRRDDRLDLRMTAAVNGVELGGDTLANMAWSFEDLVVYASRGTRVGPGDVLGSGTCQNGCLLELWGRRGEKDPPPLSPGDVVTLTVEGIGTISNRVVPGVDPVPVPPARRREESA